MLPILALVAAPALAGNALEAVAPDELPPIDIVSVGPERIINGEDADEDDYPMTGGTIFEGTVDLGSFGGTQDIQTFMCSSTLIAPDVVLLAAHCIDDDALTYGLGTVEDKKYYWSRQADLSDYDGSGAFKDVPDDAIEAIGWAMPDDWDLFGLQTGLADNWDIALIFLEEPVEDVDFAYLPQNGDEMDQLEEGIDLVVVGWGQQVATSGWGAPPAGTFMLKQQGISVLNELGDTEFQVGDGEDDVRKCHGDSGGPSFMEVETDLTVTTRLVGVTSHAYDSTDCDSKGGVDTRVDAYLDWIEDEMEAACEDGTRVYCDEPGLAEVPEEEEDLDLLDDDEDGAAGGGKGCGCSAGAAAPAMWGLVGALGLFVRRRRS